MYINSLSGGFVRDDDILISENSAIRNPPEMARIFTECGVYSYLDKTFYLYRPIQMLTYAADHAVWGIDPAGYHLTNVILHLLVAVSLYWLLCLICSSGIIPFVASVLFAVHPAYTGTVSYISARAGPLSALFALITFIFYVKYSEKASVSAYLVVIFAFILSILSRENTVIVPVLLLFYNYQFRKKTDMRLAIPLILIAVSYAVLRATLLRDIIIDSNIAFKTTSLQRLPGFFSAITDHLKLLISPQCLKTQCADRPINFSSSPVIAGIAMTPMLLFLAFRSRKSAPLAGLAFIWFLTGLFSLLILYPIGGTYSVRQWLYLPSIGIFIAAAVYLERIYFVKYLKIPVMIAVAGLILLSSYIAASQVLYWRDPLNLYEMTLKALPRSVKANNDLALAYEKAGRHSEAIDMYNRMLRENPDHPDIYVNLSAIQIIKRNPESAEALCLKAIELEGTNATAHNNLAVAYYMQCKYELAVEECDLALKYGYKVKQELMDLLKPYRDEQTIHGK